MSQSRLVQEQAGHRVAPLELFFDLVFVYGISQVTGYLADDHSSAGFLKGLLLAALLWWAWVAYSWIGTSIRVEQRLVQLALFVAMAALMIVAVAMPQFFDPDRGASLAMVAAGAYVVVRLMHVVIFYLAGREDPGITAAVARLSRTVVLAAILLVGGAYLGGTAQVVLVAVAVLIDVVGAFIGGGAGWRLSLTHFAERHSLIVIIALGEGIVAIGVGVAGAEITPSVLLLIVIAVFVACALWAAYFGRSAQELESAVEARTGLDRITTARDVYSVMHFALIAGLILIALAVKSALKGMEYGWSEPLAGYAAASLGLGVFAFLAGLWLMRRRAGAPTSGAELIVAAVSLLLVWAGTVVPAIVAMVAALALITVWLWTRSRAGSTTIPAAQ